MKKLPAILIAATFFGGGLQAQPAEDAVFTPSNPPELKPIASHRTPAYQAARLFRHGVNLGDYLEAGTDWAVTIAADEFVQMKRTGFDHVRVPVGWHRYAGAAPAFTLSPEIFARVDFAVTLSLANKMAVMINLHHFNELDN